jgi:AAA domain
MVAPDPPNSNSINNDGHHKPRFHLYREADLANLPPTKWLISGILPEGKLSVLYGQYACGKSFAALDMCLCLATGRAWHTRKVQCTPGRVIYIAAEGLNGIWQRIKAWKQENYIDADTSIRVIGDAPQLPNDGNMSVLRAAIRDHLGLDTQPAMIVIDTLHRSMVGFDEDRSKERVAYPPAAWLRISLLYRHQRPAEEEGAMSDEPGERKSTCPHPWAVVTRRGTPSARTARRNRRR